MGNPFASGFAIVTISGLVVPYVIHAQGDKEKFRQSRVKKVIRLVDLTKSRSSDRRGGATRDSLSFSREIAVRPHRPRPIKTAL